MCFVGSNWELKIALTLNNKCLLSNNFDFILKSSLAFARCKQIRLVFFFLFLCTEYVSLCVWSFLFFFRLAFRQTMTTKRKKGNACQFKNSVIILNQCERFYVFFLFAFSLCWRNFRHSKRKKERKCGMREWETLKRSGAKKCACVLFVFILDT